MYYGIFHINTRKIITEHTEFCVLHKHVLKSMCTYVTVALYVTVVRLQGAKKNLPSEVDVSEGLHDGCGPLDVGDVVHDLLLAGGEGEVSQH